MSTSGPSHSYVEAVVETILQIHSKTQDGHILVFLTGQDEIEKACSLLKLSIFTKKSLFDRELIVLPLYAALSAEAQRKVFMDPEHLDMPLNGDYDRLHARKCIVATNIAETSITVSFE
jgi:HrpA-like RNA helicase